MKMRLVHPENILLCMIADDRQYVRELGLRRIMKAKSLKQSIRKFEIPPLNFQAADYIDLIQWSNCTVTVPPLLMDMSEEQLRALVDGHAPPVIDVQNFPCHTQSVERCVKLVSEASASVCGINTRDGFIRLRLRSRELMHKFESKQDYKRQLH